MKLSDQLIEYDAIIRFPTAVNGRVVYISEFLGQGVDK